MNKKRRMKLNEAVQHLEAAHDIVEWVLDEEEECLENTPENLQESDAYARREEIVDSLDTAKGALEDAQSSIEEAIEEIGNAIE